MRAHAHESLAGLEARVRHAGLKLTKPRLAILRALHVGKHRLLTIDELAKKLHKECDWSTAYRCLRKFEAAGIVASVVFSDGQARYELLEAHGHHHHVICTQCKRVTPLAACSVGKLEANPTALGFTGLTHRLEFFGVCGRCQ